VLISAARCLRALFACGALALTLIAMSSSVASAAPASAALAVVPVEPAPGGADVADLAAHYVGSPYRWGGASPAGFDCTGFVMWIYSQFGVSLPHTEAGQLGAGQQVDSSSLQPGDVLVFANTYRRGLSHVGIYLGGGQFVHAVDERHGVLISQLWDGYWGPRFVGASRALPASP
jgi:cell wall-associated NlpC family hydrolase